ncbi:hypothetical protein MSAN_01387100 [Mycena sanguinolenta]|uniref:Uncharacterized protein n=1 Tax=Mycena sanguinolenta TaxID=230812 RepID=A0A8H7D0K0_9AGAR|nr:hypothetical protein MSAN_01387100 [Mycena sanguinolenta]
MQSGYPRKPHFTNTVCLMWRPCPSATGAVLAKVAGMLSLSLQSLPPYNATAPRQAASAWTDNQHPLSSLLSQAQGQQGQQHQHRDSPACHERVVCAFDPHHRSTAPSPPTLVIASDGVSSSSASLPRPHHSIANAVRRHLSSFQMGPPSTVSTLPPFLPSTPANNLVVAAHRRFVVPNPHRDPWISLELASLRSRSKVGGAGGTLEGEGTRREGISLVALGIFHKNRKAIKESCLCSSFVWFF